MTAPLLIAAFNRLGFVRFIAHGKDEEKPCCGGAGAAGRTQGRQGASKEAHTEAAECHCAKGRGRAVEKGVNQGLDYA